MLTNKTMSRKSEIAKYLEDTDCALISYKSNPDLYVVAKKFSNTGWVVRRKKTKKGSYTHWLTRKQVMNGRCKQFVLPKQKLTKAKAKEILSPHGIKFKPVILGRQWESKKEEPITGLEIIGLTLISVVTFIGMIKIT